MTQTLDATCSARVMSHLKSHFKTDTTSLPLIRKKLNLPRQSTSKSRRRRRKYKSSLELKTTVIIFILAFREMHIRCIVSSKREAASSFFLRLLHNPDAIISLIISILDGIQRVAQHRPICVNIRIGQSWSFSLGLYFDAFQALLLTVTSERLVQQNVTSCFIMGVLMDDGHYITVMTFRS